MNKRGDTLVKNIIELLVAVVAIGFLIILMIRIFSPVQSVPELVAENYLDSLEVALDEAKETGSSEFLMYSSEPNPYFLVYFGPGYSFDKKVSVGQFCKECARESCSLTLSFEPLKSKKNNLCICNIIQESKIESQSLAEDLKISCKYCIQKNVNTAPFEQLIEEDFSDSSGIFVVDDIGFAESDEEATDFVSDAISQKIGNFTYFISGYPIEISYSKDTKSYEFGVTSLKENKINKIRCG